MGRWEPDAAGRLQQAAFELYDGRGFESTTVADIAEHAGLTKRTFFRHFADKREVFFWRSDELERLIVEGTRGTPADVSPLDAVMAGLHAASGLFESRREFVMRRQRIVDTSAELQERELMKFAHLSAAVTSVLRERGVGDPAAGLAADTGLTVLRAAFATWVAGGNERPLDELLDETLRATRAVAGAA
jgi:AcrR family transcriptional regulator